MRPADFARRSRNRSFTEDGFHQTPGMHRMGPALLISGAPAGLRRSSEHLVMACPISP